MTDTEKNFQLALLASVALTASAGTTLATITSFASGDLVIHTVTGMTLDAAPR
jgi:hypothetical protein